MLVSTVPDYMGNNIEIPTIQREPKIWTLEQKQDFIDSLYNDYDIPKLYFRIKQNQPDKWILLDGQQRLSTTVEFLNNKFRLGESSTMPAEIRKKLYREISPTHKQRIVGKVLDCIQVECTDDEEEMFTRLNNGTPLSAAERRNAVRGEFNLSIKSIAKHKFFKN